MIISLTSADPIADEDREPVLVTVGPEQLRWILRTLAAARRDERRVRAAPPPVPAAPPIPSWQA